MPEKWDEAQFWQRPQCYSQPPQVIAKLLHQCNPAVYSYISETAFGKHGPSLQHLFKEWANCRDHSWLSDPPFSLRDQEIEDHQEIFWGPVVIFFQGCIHSYMDIYKLICCHVYIYLSDCSLSETHYHYCWWEEMLRLHIEQKVCRRAWDMIVFIISNIKNSATKVSRDVASNLHFLAKGKHMEITYLRHEMLMVLPKKNAA